jgi:RNA polymerase sigma factor (sigma-70 family)
MSPRISTRLLATQSDERLVALIQHGHERAFEALVHRYRRPLMRYCAGMSFSEARAEDVLQQAFLKAWIALSHGTEVRELRPWLYRIAHNTALNSLRTHGAETQDLRQDETQLQARADSDELETALAAREALAGMAALPPMQREVMFRTALGGHSHEEVASALGISDGAVRGLLYRARGALRTAMTGLTPPQLVSWIAARGSQAGAGGHLTELATGGGTAGASGLLLKSGILAMTAGAALTGAVAVRSSHPVHHARSARPVLSRSASTSYSASLDGGVVEHRQTSGVDRSLQARHLLAARPQHGLLPSNFRHKGEFVKAPSMHVQPVVSVILPKDKGPGEQSAPHEVTDASITAGGAIQTTDNGHSASPSPDQSLGGDPATTQAQASGGSSGDSVDGSHDSTNDQSGGSGQSASTSTGSSTSDGGTEGTSSGSQSTSSGS